MTQSSGGLAKTGKGKSSNAKHGAKVAEDANDDAKLVPPVEVPNSEER
jgi:hypothetical protein